MTVEREMELAKKEKTRKENYARRSQAAVFYNKVYMKGKENTNYSLDIIAKVFAFIETIIDCDKPTDEICAEIDDYLVKITS